MKNEGMIITTLILVLLNVTFKITCIHGFITTKTIIIKQQQQQQHEQNSFALLQSPPPPYVSTTTKQSDHLHMKKNKNANMEQNRPSLPYKTRSTSKTATNTTPKASTTWKVVKDGVYFLYDNAIIPLVNKVKEDSESDDVTTLSSSSTIMNGYQSPDIQSKLYYFDSDAQPDVILNNPSLAPATKKKRVPKRKEIKQQLQLSTDYKFRSTSRNQWEEIKKNIYNLNKDKDLTSQEEKIIPTLYRRGTMDTFNLKALFTPFIEETTSMVPFESKRIYYLVFDACLNTLSIVVNTPAALLSILTFSIQIVSNVPNLIFYSIEQTNKSIKDTKENIENVRLNMIQTRENIQTLQKNVRSFTTFPSPPSQIATREQIQEQQRLTSTIVTPDQIQAQQRIRKKSFSDNIQSIVNVPNKVKDTTSSIQSSIQQTSDSIQSTTETVGKVTDTVEKVIGSVSWIVGLTFKTTTSFVDIIVELNSNSTAISPSPSSIGMIVDGTKLQEVAIVDITSNNDKENVNTKNTKSPFFAISDSISASTTTAPSTDNKKIELSSKTPFYSSKQQVTTPKLQKENVVPAIEISTNEKIVATTNAPIESVIQLSNQNQPLVVDPILRTYPNNTKQMINKEIKELRSKMINLQEKNDISSRETNQLLIRLKEEMEDSRSKV